MKPNYRELTLYNKILLAISPQPVYNLALFRPPTTSGENRCQISTSNRHTNPSKITTLNPKNMPNSVGSTDEDGTNRRENITNDFLTLVGIPLKAFDYRLGTRSALEWIIIDQYRVKTDKWSGIVNDPNRSDDPQYIVKLIGKVITVSLETVDIVSKLPALEIK